MNLRRPLALLRPHLQRTLMSALLLVGALAGRPAAAVGESVSSTPSPEAGRLREQEASLAARLRNSPFRQPLIIDSSQQGGVARGDVHAVLHHPFSLIDTSLVQPAQWCQVLILHLNVKACRPHAHDVSLLLGTKHEQAAGEGYDLALRFAPEVLAPDYLRIALRADHGPMGTSNYVFLLEATPDALDPQNATFVHFSYQVGYGVLARMAMQGYLMTVAHDKVGFTRTGTAPDGEPVYIGGTQGTVERNAMRYHLAIATYLDTLDAPAATRVNQRLLAWFDATERYPQQLHEIERDEYLQMKQHEIAR